MQDAPPSPSQELPPSTPKFRPFASPEHQVTKGRYITSNDARGFIPVYEYPLLGQWIMMDADDGYVLWTGIWKALGNSKADIVRMVESQPDLAPHVRRVRGGYLKIQGTWLPYEVALRLSRRVAWPIRNDLIPLFGPTFPDTCLSPDQPGYGQVVPSGAPRRRRRTVAPPAPNPPPRPRLWPDMPSPASPLPPSYGQQPFPASQQYSPQQYAPQPPAPLQQQQYAYQPAVGRDGRQPPALVIPGPSREREHDGERPHSTRYAPYPGSALSLPRGRASASSSPVESLRSPVARSEGSGHTRSPSNDFVLPPIRQSGHRHSSSGSGLTLPPIASLPGLGGSSDSEGIGRGLNDAAAVLRRLKLADAEDAKQANSRRAGPGYPADERDERYGSGLGLSTNYEGQAPRRDTRIDVTWDSARSQRAQTYPGYPQPQWLPPPPLHTPDASPSTSRSSSGPEHGSSSRSSVSPATPYSPAPDLQSYAGDRAAPLSPSRMSATGGWGSGAKEAPSRPPVPPASALYPSYHDARQWHGEQYVR